MSPQNLVKEGLTRKIFRNKDLGVRFQRFKVSKLQRFDVQLGLACLENLLAFVGPCLALFSSSVVCGATGHESIVNLLWAQSRLFVTSRQVLAVEKDRPGPLRSRPASLSPEEGERIGHPAIRKAGERPVSSPIYPFRKQILAFVYIRHRSI